jgi:hypothetical protein
LNVFRFSIKLLNNEKRFNLTGVKTMTSEHQIDNIMTDLERLSQINSQLRKNLNFLIQEKCKLNKEIAIWRAAGMFISYSFIAAVIVLTLFDVGF